MSVLMDLVAGAAFDAQRRRDEVPLDAVAAAAERRPDPLPVAFRLANPTEVSVIAEVKRSSPSKGALATIGDPAALAQRYAAGGAAMISVLTEGHRFGGSLADLDAVRAVVDIPVLRKDFLTTEYQLVEARAHGADCVLLIVAAHDDPAELQQLFTCATDLGMDVLVETHTGAEIEVAHQIGAKILGINARNLHTLDVDIAVFPELLDAAGDRVVRVAESGIHSVGDASAAAHAGADALLVGEYLVTSEDPTAAITELRLSQGH